MRYIYWRQSNHMPPFTYIWTFLLLFSSATSENEMQSAIECDGLFYWDVYYDKHILFETHEKPYNLVYDRYTGELLFSHTIQRGQEINFQIMTCNIKKQICRPVDGVTGGYAIGYDRIHDEFYMGGHHGLFKYNIETQQVRYFAERGKSVWGIFIRRHFYYIQHPSQQLYVYKKKKFRKVPETIGIEIDNFFITRNFIVYFSNRTGLFKAKINKREKKPYILAKEIDIRQITEDLYGVVYFCASDGIYVEDLNKKSIRKIANIDQLFSITFMDHFYLSPKKEFNQLVYSDKYAIYVLTHNNHSSLCEKLYKTTGVHKPVKLVKVVV